MSTHAELLDQVRHARAAHDRARTALDDAVFEAVAGGCPSREVGDAAGISHDTALRVHARMEAANLADAERVPDAALQARLGREGGR